MSKKLRATTDEDNITDDEVELVQRYSHALEGHLLKAFGKFEFDEKIADDLEVIGTQMAFMIAALWHRCVSGMIVTDDAGNRRLITEDEFPDHETDREAWLRMASDLYDDFHE